MNDSDAKLATHFVDLLQAVGIRFALEHDEALLSRGVLVGQDLDIRTADAPDIVVRNLIASAGDGHGDLILIGVRRSRRQASLVTYWTTQPVPATLIVDMKHDPDAVAMAHLGARWPEIPEPRRDIGTRRRVGLVGRYLFTYADRARDIVGRVQRPVGHLLDVRAPARLHDVVVEAVSQIGHAMDGVAISVVQSRLGRSAAGLRFRLLRRRFALVVTLSECRARKGEQRAITLGANEESVVVTAILTKMSDIAVATLGQAV